MAQSGSEILTMIEEDRVGDYRSKRDKDYSVRLDGMHLRMLKELVIITARLLTIFHFRKVVVIGGDIQMTWKKANLSLQEEGRSRA